MKILHLAWNVGPGRANDVNAEFGDWMFVKKRLKRATFNLIRRQKRRRVRDAEPGDGPVHDGLATVRPHPACRAYR